MENNFEEAFPDQDNVSSVRKQSLQVEYPLTWEDSYPIALALHNRFPDVKLEDVSLGMVFRWTIQLPNFIDDPALANHEILSSIYQEWFEEVNSL
jgi:FeS assembly protein IscX